MKKHTVKHVATMVDAKHMRMMPEQVKLNFFTKYPPKNVPEIGEIGWKFVVF